VKVNGCQCAINGRCSDSVSGCSGLEKFSLVTVYPSLTGGIRPKHTLFAKPKSNFKDLSNERHSRRGACIFRHIRTCFAFYALASTPVFHVMLSLLFSWTGGIQHSVRFSRRSHGVTTYRHCLVLRDALLPDSGSDRATFLVVAPQVTAIFARGGDGLNVCFGSDAACCRCHWVSGLTSCYAGLYGLVGPKAGIGHASPFTPTR
jgi:hypothetical protein